MIALIDYGAGNLTSVRKALTALGADFTVPESPADLIAPPAIVPGVGHFAAPRARSTRRGARRSRRRGARGTPLFGICVGMQWLFEGSDEAPGGSGLGVMNGPDPSGDGRAPKADGAAQSPSPSRCGTALARRVAAGLQGRASRAGLSHPHRGAGHDAV